MVVAAIDRSSKKAAPAAKKETLQKQKVEKKEDKKEVQEKWQSAIFAERALLSVLRFPILIIVPTELGSLM